MLRGFFLLTLLSLTGCSVALGGHYLAGGPHPWVSAVIAARVGPVEVMHTAVSNARPVVDLTRLSVNYGPTFGQFNPTLGVGWAWFRDWGACNEEGYWCEHTWTSAPTVGLGLTYQKDSARLDVAGHCYGSNAPFNCAGVFLIGVNLF